MRKIQQDKEETPMDETTISKDSTLEGNAEADIALFGVSKKLSSPLSVECQVQELITTAIDPKLLCALFHGWQPFL